MPTSQVQTTPHQPRDKQLFALVMDHAVKLKLVFATLDGWDPNVMFQLLLPQLQDQLKTLAVKTMPEPHQQLLLF
jgi:hypothetical protein